MLEIAGRSKVELAIKQAQQQAQQAQQPQQPQQPAQPAQAQQAQAQQQPQAQQQAQASGAEAEAGSGFVPASDDLDDLPEAEAAGAVGGDNQRRPRAHSMHTDATIELIFAKLLEAMPHVPPQERKVRTPNPTPNRRSAR